MIYFLINNNYHLDLDLKLAKQLTGHKLGLIQVPYSLNVIDKSNIFSEVFHFPERLYLSLRHPFQILRIKRIVDNAINPSCNDILFVHAERDLLNQYIIQSFYKVKAKIYLLEDGTATICHYNMPIQKATLKNRLKCIILKKLFNFKYTKIGKYGAETLHTMDDSIFSGVIVNYGNSIRRNIPFYKLTAIKEPIAIHHEEGALFLSQALYLWYNTEKEYIKYVLHLLTISKNFTPFYFKFHPSESEYVKSAITKLITEKYSSITIITEDSIAEDLISKYSVKYAITFNSTSALNLINKGIIPIFLNTLLNKTFPHPIFDSFNQFLKSINYSSPQTLSEIKPGFLAFENTLQKEITKSIREILELNND